MFIRGEALVDTVTLTFAISGKRGEWAVTITQPGGIVTEDETVEASWYPLFTEMLRAAFENANRRRFPERHREAVR